MIKVYSLPEAEEFFLNNHTDKCLCVKENDDLIVNSYIDAIAFFDKPPVVKHYLKTVEPHFTELRSGRKSFEIRKDDRDFKNGDLVQCDHYPYNGQAFTFTITHILRNAPEYGLMPGYCILSFNNNPF